MIYKVTNNQKVEGNLMGFQKIRNTVYMIIQNGFDVYYLPLKHKSLINIISNNRELFKNDVFIEISSEKLDNSKKSPYRYVVNVDGVILTEKCLTVDDVIDDLIKSVSQTKSK